jgi:hypothetical protein
MTFTIELAPETEAAVRAKASARGMDVTEYIRTLTEQAVEGTQPTSERSREEFKRAWRAFCEPMPELPILGPESFTRESFYADHD